MTWQDEIIKYKRHKFDSIFIIKLREAIEDLVDKVIDEVSEKDMDALEASDYSNVVLALKDEVKTMLDKIYEDIETAKY